jgi:hypothetical protein
VFPEGIGTARIDIPRNISIGSRTRVLMAIMNQVVALNPMQTQEQILNRALVFNSIITKEPLGYEKVIGIVSSIVRYNKEGTLTPINNKIRKVIFNEKSRLSREEKVAIVNKEVGAIRTERTKQRIYNAIEGWNVPDKITAKKIAIVLNLGLSTVKRYWPEFKALVKDGG